MDDKAQNEELTNDEKEEKEHNEFVRMADQSLDRFRDTHSEPQQQFIVDAYVETGEILTGEAYGIDPVEAAVVETAFSQHLDRNVLRQHGLTLATYFEHVDEADYPALRRAAAKGEWHVFHGHAQAIAAARKTGTAFTE
ncbi:hypothetical protein [Mesorhizobium sp. M7A.F.Ca.MR.245.00.0.0]|uniref:hypothetical protein n=1 Tax=Mesorhizobium sp. M7A.F.Ca.MR.245.00.0.0 TaxID=2496778 RepID=UPI000FCA38B7|nr:hypothetical protein [Mesorhizobium sp. M7A.F.Ca.MR.245.00.0.0]RUV18898.1 hypothetical protein EOB80_21390 [Mesorhizobium sp. M7A.F.Ca.MR.245.00.0.0]RUV51051.1 hypothetical protein EOB77_12500 [Mesorhizobium sp. M7A.F.Ca.MR.228.00.0.0]